MRVSASELEERGIHLKGWLAAMQRACKSADAPAFQLNGPVNMRVRIRRPTGPVATGTSGWAFNGSERFRLSTVYTEKDVTRAQELIGVSLVPADIELAKEVAGVTMPLSEAIEKFDGLLEWTEQLAAHSHELAPERAAKTARASPAEFHRRESSPERGSW